MHGMTDAAGLTRWFDGVDKAEFVVHTEGGMIGRCEVVVPASPLSGIRRLPGAPRQIP